MAPLFVFMSVMHHDTFIPQIPSQFRASFGFLFCFFASCVTFGIHASLFMRVWLDHLAFVCLAFRSLIPHLEWQASVNLR